MLENLDCLEIPLHHGTLFRIVVVTDHRKEKIALEPIGPGCAGRDAMPHTLRFRMLADGVHNGVQIVLKPDGTWSASGPFPVGAALPEVEPEAPATPKQPAQEAATTRSNTAESKGDVKTKGKRSVVAKSTASAAAGEAKAPRKRKAT
jgi:hypothetical protein